MMRNLYSATVILIMLCSVSFPQVNYDKSYLDSLYTQYVSLKEAVTNKQIENLSDINFSEAKCGFHLINFVKQNIGLFTPEQQFQIKKVTARPTTAKSIVSPSGKFRIHYDTTSVEKPNYNSSLSIAENLALISTAIDSVFNFEVNYLGYPPPPPDNGAGSDNLYDIYIVNLGGGLYGYTESENSLGGQKFTSFMVIDNDYAGYYSSGLKGAQATLAHEFHHGIQMGNYILRFEDTFFYEISSTAMEEFVYDDVNDYYAYMPSYFNSTQKAFAENDGYNLAAWNIFLKDNFGFNILKRQWELMPSQRALNAINISIIEKSSSFKHELNNFGIWTYHTKHRTIAGKYFEEAVSYPLVRPMVTKSFTSPDEVVTIFSKSTANNFIRFTSSVNTDSLFVLITNGNVQSALTNLSATDSFAYYLYDYPAAGTTQIDSTFYSKFTTSNPQFWSIAEILDTIKTIEPQLKTDYPYPMPFSYKTHFAERINIPVSTMNSNEVGLYIFTSAMVLVYSNDGEPRNNQNKNSISWQVRDNQNQKLASGVYIYVIKDGDDVQKGKLVILHD